MKTTRRSLFGLLAGTSVATLAGGASAMSGSVAEKPGVPMWSTLRGKRLCDLQSYRGGDELVRIGCGRVFDFITTINCICPHCGFHYELSGEYMRERASRPEDEPRVWTTQLWIDERKRDEDRWRKL